MNPTPCRILFAACLALSGCGGKLIYGEMEEPTLVLTQPLGQTVPGAPPVPVTFNVPDIPLSGGSTTSKEAGFTIGSSMKLNQAALIMSPSSNADFNGFDTLTLTISSATQTQKTLARYTKDPANLPGQRLRQRHASREQLDRRRGPRRSPQGDRGLAVEAV